MFSMTRSEPLNLSLTGAAGTADAFAREVEVAGNVGWGGEHSCRQTARDPSFDGTLTLSASTTFSLK